MTRGVTRKRATENPDATPRWDTGTFKIKNPAELAGVLDRVLEKGYLFLADAAEEIGISRSTLYRLVHGSVKVISWRTANRLKKWLTAREWQKVEPCLYDERTREARREYVDFLKREMARFRWRRGEEHDFFFTNKQIREAVDSFEKHSRGLGFTVWRTELAKLRENDPIIGRPRQREFHHRLGRALADAQHRSF